RSGGASSVGAGRRQELVEHAVQEAIDLIAHLARVDAETHAVPRLRIASLRARPRDHGAPAQIVRPTFDGRTIEPHVVADLETIAARHRATAAAKVETIGLDDAGRGS